MAWLNVVAPSPNQPVAPNLPPGAVQGPKPWKPGLIVTLRTMFTVARDIINIVALTTIAIGVALQTGAAGQSSLDVRRRGIRRRRRAAPFQPDEHHL